MIGKVFAMTEGAACSEGWIFVGLFPFHLQFITLFCLFNVPPPTLSHLGKLLQAPGREHRRAVKARAERNE